MRRVLGWVFDRVMAKPMARFHRCLERPAQAQLEALRRILALNRDTAFGREHGFAPLLRLPERELWDGLRRSVPIRPYPGFSPYIERMKNGEPDVLLPGRPEMFSLTSGTTAEAKHCPVNRAFVKEHHRQHLIWMYHAYRDHPGINAGKYLTLTSPAEMGRTAGGIPYGAMSGKQLEVQSIPIRRRMAAPGRVQSLPDAADRWFAFILFGLSHPDVSVVTAVNPTSLVVMAQVLAGRREELLAALESGYRGPAELAALFRPDPERAARLRSGGDLTPMAAWPGLGMVFTWQGGSAAFHLPRVRELWGDVPKRCLGLRASEGTFSIPLRDNDPSGVLAVDGHAMEFIPADLGEPAPDAPTLLAHELERDGLYRLVISTSAGLCRYDLGDLVRVTGMNKSTPEIAFERRAGSVLSATGEKVTENQAVSALSRATADGPAVAGFSLTWEMAEDRVRYVLALELAGGEAFLARDPGGLSALARKMLAAFDDALTILNCEYGSKRKDGRILPPRAVLLADGAYDALRARAAAAGRPESQVKQPHLLHPPKPGEGKGGFFAEVRVAAEL